MPSSAARTGGPPSPCPDGQQGQHLGEATAPVLLSPVLYSGTCGLALPSLSRRKPVSE